MPPLGANRIYAGHVRRRCRDVGLGFGFRWGRVLGCRCGRRLAVDVKPVICTSSRQRDIGPVVSIGPTPSVACDLSETPHNHYPIKITTPAAHHSRPKSAHSSVPFILVAAPIPKTQTSIAQPRIPSTNAPVPKLRVQCCTPARCVES
jgi:hypothetical protein